MINTELKLAGLIGVSKELNPSPLFNENAYNSVGQFDDVDGTDSDTQMRRTFNNAGGYIFFKTYEGSNAIIDYVPDIPNDIPPLNLVPGNKYIVQCKINSLFVDDPEINSTIAYVTLGTTRTGTNTLSVINQSGIIEGIVTCDGNELHLEGFSDVAGSWVMTYLSIREYKENEVNDTIDLYDDIPFPLNFQIDDISDPSKKKTNFSKTITIPGTKNNNKIFEHIFNIETDLSNTVWNPNKKLDIVVYKDKLEQFRGILKLDNIILNDLKQVEYEVTLFSSLTNIFLEIGESELRDLDFSEYDHILNAQTQFASWGPEFGAALTSPCGSGHILRNGCWYENFFTSGPNNNKPKGEGYVYALINNGRISMLDIGLAGNQNLTGPVARVEDIMPAIYLREYIKKIFDSVGYTWTSDLLDSVMFRKLVILPTNEQLRMTQADIDRRKFKVLSTFSQHNAANHPELYFTDVNAGLPITDTVHYNDETGTGAHDTQPIASYDNSGSGKWVVNKGGTYSFNAVIGLDWTFSNLKTFLGATPDVSNPVYANFYQQGKLILNRRFINGGAVVNIGEVVVEMDRYTNAITGATLTTPRVEATLSVSNLELITGDEIFVTFESKHLLQTDINNTISGTDQTPQGLFYQATPPTLSPVKELRSAPPLIPPVAGTRYLVQNSPTGDFAGQPGKIATYNLGAYTFFDPPLYSQVKSIDDNINLIRVGSGFLYTGIANDTNYNFLPTYVRMDINPTSYTNLQKNTNSGTAVLNINAGYFFQNDVASTDITDGSTITMNSAVPDRVKQIDLIKSIFTMFNCYVYENPDLPKNIIIEPRDDFYNDETADWSQKLDYSKPIEVVPMSELNAKKYIFSYTQDSDFINKNYLNNYSLNELPYGSYVAEYDNDFLVDKKEIKLPFGPTPVWRMFPTKTALPAIIDDEYKPFKNNLRILFYNGKEIEEPSWTHQYQVAGVGTSYSARQLPSFNMDDDMYTPSVSLKWGQSGTEYYWSNVDGDVPYSRTTNTLYNKYYFKYMSEILNKNSRLIKAYFDLRAIDIRNLSFKKKYYFDGHWCRLYLIEDFDPNTNDTYKCWFLKINEGVSFTGTYGENVPLGGGTNPILEGSLLDSGTLRLEDTPTRQQETAALNGSIVEETRYQNADGSNNQIDQSAERINIVGDNNVVYSQAQKVEIINSNNNIVGASAKNISIVNSDDVTIAAGVQNVIVQNTSRITVNESNVSYINGTRISSGVLVQGVYNSVIEGGKNQLQSPYSFIVDNVINGGLDSTRELDSHSNIMIIDGDSSTL
jgi:hypothetical protein